MSTVLDPITARQLERLPPYDEDSERAALGSLLLCGTDNRETFDLIRTTLRREWFFVSDNQVIYDVVCDLADDGKPVDSLTVRSELARRQQLEEIGGSAYLGEVLGSVPDWRHGPHYAETVREKAVLRGMVSISNDILRRCYGPSRGVSAVGEIVREFLGQLTDLTAESAGASFQRLSDAIRERLGRKKEGDEQLVPTGIPTLDAQIGGLPRGKFILVGGRPGSGKSLLCKQFALNVAAAGGHAGIVTIEETNDKIAENALANASGIENKRISFGNLGEHDWVELELAQRQLEVSDVWLSDKPTRLSEVEEAVTTAAVRHGCELVIVDYLQLIDAGQGETENREITRISQSLKRLAKRLNIALVAAAQLNRGNESNGVRRPSLRDLRGSGSLEQDGDLIILLHREDYYRYAEPDYQPTGQVEAIVAKFKNGEMGVIPLTFSGKTQSITDWVSKDPFMPSPLPKKAPPVRAPFDPWTGNDL